MTGDVAAESAPKPNRRGDALRRTAGVLRLDQFALFPVIILAVIVGAIVNDAFLTQTNLVNVLRQSSELSILVMAEALILIAGKFDLSLESIVGLAPAVAAWLVLAPD